MVYCFVSFVLTLIINIPTGTPFSPNIVEIMGVAWAGFFVTGVASTLWAIALESGNTAKISNHNTTTTENEEETTVAEDEETTAENKDEKGGIPAGVIIAIVAAVVVIAGIAVALAKKKK